MNERPYLKRELQKLEAVRKYLKQENIESEFVYIDV